jgi:uncharacterized membrane protein
MEGLVILIALGFVLAVFVLPIAAFVRAGRAQRETSQLITRITSLEVELVRLKRKPAEPSPEPIVPSESVVTRTSATTEPPPWEQPLASALLEAREQKPSVPSEEPVGASTRHEPAPLHPPVRPATPPPLPPRPAPAIPEARPDFNLSRLKGTLNWEQFMGAKLFAWIGGLALFLGVAYFVKYSFEHNLIPPEVRVAIGFLVGMGLVAAGVVMRRKEYAITAQTLCATGILILYAVTFACRAVYHFPFFGPVPTFALMTLVTATAFLLAVRMEAQVVAILGILGGFLTPVLLSTGQDAPVALFAYIGLLDAGLLAVALHQRWLYLAPLAAAGTVLMQVGWSAKFFERSILHRKQSCHPDDRPAFLQRSLARGHPLRSSAQRKRLVRPSLHHRPGRNLAGLWILLHQL